MNAQKKIAFISPNIFDIREVKVSVRLGNPHYSDCRNFGICKMDTKLKSDAYIASKLHFANALLRKNEDKIFLCFIKKSMHPQTINFHFGKGVFQVSTKKEIDLQICKRLNLVSFFIEPNIYNINNTEQYFELRIQ